MHITYGFAYRVAALLGLIGCLSQQSNADTLYSVTNLGPAAPATGGLYATGYYPYLNSQTLLYPNGNYLGALSPSEQAAFQSGSFDIYAHPATTSLYGVEYYQNGNTSYRVVNSYESTVKILDFNMITSNNLGVTVGIGTQMGYQLDAQRLVVFTPDPQLVSMPYPSTQQVQSPGDIDYYFTKSDQTYSQFYGSPAGINDHGNVAVNEFTWPASAGGYGVVLPHLIIGGTDTSLGSLGGVNGAAYALNNSNEVVGWSQIASGAQHAFLYSNGTMQDLNLLIPTLSGVTLTSAVGIDAAGEIVAFGTDASGQTNEYLLTPSESPVPEPSTLAIMGVMIVALAARRAYSRQS